jgi:tetratricopeptide (TPR) repeat protein
LIPVIGIVQVGSQSIADRYTYIPYVGLFLIIAWTFAELLGKSLPKPAIALAFAAPILACIVLTRSQVRYWKNGETLFSHALAVTTNNLTAELILGSALTDNGKLPEAMAHFEAALRLDPKYADAHGKLAYILAGQGKFSEAVQHYRQALETKPDLPEALNNLAWILATHLDAQFRNGAEAVRLAERACQLTKNQKTIYIGTLAAAYAEAGRFPEAIATAKKAEANALTWKEKDLAEKNRQLIELYKANKPYRE